MDTLVLRLFATSSLVLTACLVAFDSQTKLLFYSMVRKASFRDLKALSILVWVASAAAAYNVLQILRSRLFPQMGKNLAWFGYLLDQAVAYLVFAANSAALQGCVFAVSGQSNFGWMKVCDKYTRFCIQIGGALICGYAACLAMAVISALSAYGLFRLYSPKHFLQLKHQ
ncbi:unnamed protein product [Coffea canephora]|uniref:CASP-like protein n=2 Tax=Coffea TaxID=13442 RepID=A0A068U477_COFCA|nr:CASP-like protein 2C1 [Coffea arabica]CDP02964.1 unnamed protein product [Coffea canephora]